NYNTSEYCETDTILPIKIKALRGSCVIINCRFEINKQYNTDLTERAKGVWLKDGTDVNRNVVFNSNTSSQNFFIRGNITGKLKDKDCTTVFYDLRSNHSGRYYFRIETEGQLKETFKQASVSIDVFGEKFMTGNITYKYFSVSLRCSAETLCSSPPPTLTWSSTPRIPLSDSSRLQELISDLNFTATHREHGVTFTAQTTSTAEQTAKLTVLFSVILIPSSSVLEGSSVTLICSSDANPAVNYTWSREGEGKLKQLQTGHTLTFNRTDPTHRGWYHCTAQNQYGSQNSSVMLDIQCEKHMTNKFFFFFLQNMTAVIVLVTLELQKKKKKKKPYGYDAG
uniref:Ig-like domain-containing protein n=1 Tax=Cyprinus carpio TaxID=7962 RepID=A0A8C1XQZ8_CYPCA